MAYTVTFIRGDGTGPELAEATARVLEATGVEFEWDWQDAGADVYEAEGTPMPDRVLESIRRNKVAIKAPITTPVGSGFRSVNVALRKELDLYCCLRPCKAYKGVRTRFPETDIVIVRENHEDLYAGIEFEKGSDEAAAPARDDQGAVRQGDPRGRRHLDQADLRLRHAADRALRVRVRAPNGRRKVTAAHKANIMKFSDGLFLRTARGGRQEYSGHRVRGPHHRQPVQPARHPAGGVRRDRAAEPLRGHRVRPRRGMIGGLGMAPGGNIGDEYAVFEATHGSAPKYKGMNKVNPMALMLSGVMMLRHLGEQEAAGRLESAIAAVIAEGKSVTYDMKPTRDDPTAVGTSDVADAIIER